MRAQQDTISPIDGQVYVRRDYATDRQITVALQQAQRAQQQWKQLSIEQRAHYCSAMVDAFVANKDEIAMELTWQMGRPIQYAGGEVDGFAHRARHMIKQAGEALSVKHIDSPSGCERYIQHEPLGVVLVIAPWNYPYLTAVNTIVPALMAGNSVILKHSAQTPMCAEQIARAFDKAMLPKGVFQYLHLRHEDIATVINAPQIQHVAFTGSVRGGSSIESVAAGRFIGVGLELGGKDPAYVRADANLEHAVASVVDGAFFNSGQSCCAIERAYVHEEVFDSFVKRATKLIKHYKLGRPDELSTTLGPLVRSKAADFVREQIADAKAKGATLHIDPAIFPLDQIGTPYMAPQLLTNVDHSMSIMTDESFGPVLGVQKVSSDVQAVELMNDSEFGLTAAVFTRDKSAGIAIAEQLQTGTFFLNRCDYLDPALAWTGVKNSGRGCTLSDFGYHHLTRRKSFLLMDVTD